jgi:hypothetical protein
MDAKLYPFACGKCGKRHRAEGLLSDHLAKCDPAPSFVKVDACTKCGKELTSGYCLECHRASRCGRRGR